MTDFPDDVHAPTSMSPVPDPDAVSVHAVGEEPLTGLERMSRRLGTRLRKTGGLRGRILKVMS